MNAPVESASASFRPDPVSRVFPAAAAPLPDREELARMRYFRDLLRLGFQQALRAEEHPATLRERRVALGIGLPELDLVPVWSARDRDGRIGIPFVEYLLGQFIAGVDRLARAARAGGVLRDILRQRDKIDRMLSGGSPRSGKAIPLPALEDRFLPEPALAHLCGPDGVLDRILRQCEGAVAERIPAPVRTTQA